MSKGASDIYNSDETNQQLPASLGVGQQAGEDIDVDQQPNEDHDEEHELIHKRLVYASQDVFKGYLKLLMIVD